MAKSGTARDALNEAIGWALYRMREGAGLSQAEVADRMGIGQRNYAYLESGKQRIYVDQLLAAETACGRPAGFVLREMELVVDPQTVEDAIAADVHLVGHWREVALTSYRLAVSRSAAASEPTRSATKPSRSR